MAFITDLHFDERQGLPDRLIEEVLTGVGVAKPDLILLGGDYCGHRVPHLSSPVERNWLVGLVCGLAEAAPVVAVRGNHDARGDHDFLNRLAAASAVTYRDTPGLVAVTGVADVVCLPWLDVSAVEGDWHDGVRLAYRKTLEKYVSSSPTSVPLLILGHGALAGTSVRLGQPAVPTADPVLDPAEVCPKQAGAAFWGHYHERQPIARAGCPAWYGGALTLSQYGESPDRGWILWDSHQGEPRPVQVHQGVRVSLEIKDRVVIKAAPDVLPWRNLLNESITEVRGLPVAAGKIRILLQEGQDRTEEALFAREACGEVFDPLTVEVVARAVSRAREGAEEVAHAPTIVEKVAAYFEMLDPPPAEERVGAALKLVAEVEREVREGE